MTVMLMLLLLLILLMDMVDPPATPATATDVDGGGSEDYCSTRSENSFGDWRVNS